MVRAMRERATTATAARRRRRAMPLMRVPFDNFYASAVRLTSMNNNKMLSQYVCVCAAHSTNREYLPYI